VKLCALSRAHTDFPNFFKSALPTLPRHGIDDTAVRCKPDPRMVGASFSVRSPPHGKCFHTGAASGLCGSVRAVYDERQGVVLRPTCR